MNPIRFDAHQRAALTKLGLTPEAIFYIEAEALPTARIFLRQRPPKRDVVKELLDLQKSLLKARAGIERLLGASRDVPHLHTALAHLSAGHGRYALGGLRLSETSQSLAVAIDVIEKGIADLPPGPVRHRFADPYPIELIHGAIQTGTFKATGDPYAHGMSPSVSHTSRFRRVVGVCYEVLLNQPEADPDRALRAYVKAWRAGMRRFDEQEKCTERVRKS
jgi:hypothetical protein